MSICRQSMFLLCLLWVFPGYGFAEISGDFKFQKVYENSYGAVTFNHEKHAVSAVRDCGYCHSALKVFGGKVNELFAHKVCKVCHESKQVPAECVNCHSQD
ncbi:MAG: cytochrome c3 family protein [Desulfuromonadales bacterium]